MFLDYSCQSQDLMKELTVAILCSGDETPEDFYSSSDVSCFKEMGFID